MSNPICNVERVRACVVLCCVEYCEKVLVLSTDRVITVDVREEELVCSHHRALPLETGEPVGEELAGSWDSFSPVTSQAWQRGEGARETSHGVR